MNKRFTLTKEGVIMYKYIAVFMLAASTIWAQKPVIAVLDFEPISVRSSLARGVAEFLRTELVNTGEYRVVERTKLEKVLSEQKLGMTGMVDESTASEIGKMLGAKLVVTGSVIAMGEIYTINIRMINTASGEIESARSVQCRSESEIPNACYRIAQQIATGTFETAERREVPTKYKEPVEPRKTIVGTYAQGLMDGKRDGASAGKPLWCLAGLSGTGCCLLIGCAGVGAAYMVQPSPPTYKLIGKSPEYIAGYVSAYKNKARNKNTTYAAMGCATAAVINLLINLIWNVNLYPTE